MKLRINKSAHIRNDKKLDFIFSKNKSINRRKSLNSNILQESNAEHFFKLFLNFFNFSGIIQVEGIKRRLSSFEAIFLYFLYKPIKKVYGVWK